MAMAIRKEQQMQSELEYERTAWFTSLLMNSSGNMKKNIKPSDLYNRNQDDDSENDGSPFKKIDRDKKNEELERLKAQMMKASTD
jgi:hypothetical protein